ncbi:MAG: ribonuclease R, partial [Cellvibrionales bacterium]
PFVTIDGEDARDFDDAVYCEEMPEGFRLWVAIADVSHYVAPGSALDDEAAERGNSVYFPERVVPMFPEVLSNGLCSLKPEVDRLAMVCELSIDAAGEVGSSQFYEAVIHSHARLTYTEVGQVLAQGHCDSVDGARVPDLRRLHALYRILRQARVRRGAIDFETVETRILFNAERKIEAIVPVQRNDAHKLIEECMLAANVATATFLETTEVPVLYRVHNGPSAERLGSLRDYLGELSLDLAGGDQPTPVDYQRLINAIAQRDDASIIQTQVLRSLSQACYQIDNEGHFGLNYPAYGHFTSPIRRYPDLLIHRAIRHLIRSGKHPEQTRSVKRRGKKVSSAGYPYDDTTVAALGEQCSMTERRADDATREVEAWLKCEFLRDKVGEQFQGVISAVTGFGIFVELAGLYIEGLVHISGLPGDYYHFDAAKQRLVGERTRRVFKLGAGVEVTVSRVDLQERRIDLDIVGGDGSGQKSRKPKELKPDKKPRDKMPGSRDKKPKGKKGAPRGPSTRRKKR